MIQCLKLQKRGQHLENRLTKYAKDLSQMMFGGTGNARKFNMKALGKGTEGDIFEEGVRAAIGGAKNEDRNSFFDFNGGSYAKSELIGFFNKRGATNLKSRSKIEGKIGYEAAKSGGIPNKMMNDDSVGLDYKEVLRQFRTQFTKKTKKSKALGYVPNFSPLSSSISRERQAGIPASKIRVGSSPALRSSGNPSGLGVYNTIDEPRGLNQGISRSRSMGINPKSHGAAEGFVPNFVMGPLTKTLAGTLIKMGVGKKAAVNFAKSPLQSIGKSSVGGSIGLTAGMTALGGSDSLMGSVASYGMMGIGGGLPGMLGMAGVGALMHGFPKVIDHFTSSSKDASEKLKEQIAAQKEANDAAKESAVSFGKVAESLSAADFVVQKEEQLKQIKADNPEMVNTSVFRALQSASRGDFDASLGNFYKQVDKRSSFSSAVKNLNLKQLTEEDLRTSTLPKDFSRIAPPLLPKNGSIPKMDLPKTGFAIDPNGNVVEASIIQKFKAKLAEQGITPAAKMDEFVKGGGTLELLKGSKGGVAQALGMDPSQYSELTRDLQAKLGTAKTQELEESIIKDFNSEEEYKKALERAAKIQEKINAEAANAAKAQADYTDVIHKAMKAQAEYRDSVFQLQRQLDTLKRSSTQRLAIFGVESNLRTGRAGATMTQAGAAGVGRDVALDTARINKEEAIKQATKSLEIDLKSGLKDLDIVKFIEDQKMGAPEAKRALEAFTQAREGMGNLSKGGSLKEVRNNLIKQLADVKGVGLSQEVLTSSTEEGLKNLLDLENLEPIINTLTTAYEKNERATDAASETEINATALAKKQYEVQLELLKLQRTINTVRRQEMREIQADIASAEFQEAKRLAATGQLGARGVGSAYEASVNAQIAAGGVRSVNFGGVMGQTFRNEMAYNEVDAFGDFRDGVKDVAGTMKSSFADAFQSISSGATTVQGALANMAQSILSSINQMSTQIFTNMMFSKMFGGGMAKGGYVPGYAAGGLVTGGSGYKDDVLTKMQGGEFVIKKSAVNRIGIGKLNAINGYANGGSTGPSMGTMGLVAGVSGAATGILGAAMQDRPDKPLPSRNYGMGRSSLGYLGGADPDGGQIDRASGSGTSANVSLSKGFVYYRRDPETGRLVSERARPTEGRFEVSSALSLMGRLDEGDPQTSRMFDKEQRIANYQNYIAGEKASRSAQTQAVKDQKRSRLIGAYMNAAMLVGGAKFFQGSPQGDVPAGLPDGVSGPPVPPSSFGPMKGAYIGGNANGGLAKVMGGEYVMSPQAVRTHGVDFMTELNRGNVPRYASGGLVGNQTGAVATGGSGSAMSGNMTNNVKINVNIDKSGKAEASATAGSQSGSESSREESEDVQNNADLGKALQTVVLDELIKQQRPGGLLHSQS